MQDAIDKLKEDIHEYSERAERRKRGTRGR